MVTVACSMCRIVRALEMLSYICGISPHRTRSQSSGRSQLDLPEFESGHPGNLGMLSQPRLPGHLLWRLRASHVRFRILLLVELCGWVDGLGSSTAIQMVSRRVLCACPTSLEMITSIIVHIADAVAPRLIGAGRGTARFGACGHGYLREVVSALATELPTDNRFPLISCALKLGICSMP